MTKPAEQMIAGLTSFADALEKIATLEAELARVTGERNAAMVAVFHAHMLMGGVEYDQRLVYAGGLIREMMEPGHAPAMTVAKIRAAARLEPE